MNLLEFHQQIKGYTQSNQPGIEADMTPKPIQVPYKYSFKTI
jgi:hypothetical protein